MHDIASRAVIGFFLATIVALLARRENELTAGGAVAATVVGTVCLAAGWTWALLLLVMFLTSTALTRFGRSARARNPATPADGDEATGRNAIQVLANGGVFTFAAVAFAVSPSAVSMAIGAGAIAASAADTWATEIGTLAATPPRSIVSGVTVATGESGGVTWLGSAAAGGGALLIAAAAVVAGWPTPIFWAALTGGIAGATIDSLLGATLQSRRWCTRCGIMTERRIHRCGRSTDHSRGIAWLDNDVVNAISSLGGGITGMLCLI